MFFSGFIGISEGLFELWRSDTMLREVGATAFRYGGMIALMALIIATSDD